MESSLKRVELDEAFFPVRRVGIQREDNQKSIKRHWAVVDDDSGDVFSVVTDNYRLVTNQEACELGRKAFSHIFGPEALAGLWPFNVLMPRTRSWAQIDFTAECLAFESCRGDRWFPFLRVVNSYNRTMSLQFTIGVCRGVCSNGMIFDEQSLKFQTTHNAAGDLDGMVDNVLSSGQVRFNFAMIQSRLAQLANLHVPAEHFVAGSLEILDLKVPENLPEIPLQARGWCRLGPHLKELGKRYSVELGDNAYALLNATSDYAGHARAPRMNPVLVNCFQSRCGRWAVKMADQSSAQPIASVTIAEANLAAAERLMSFAKPAE